MSNQKNPCVELRIPLLSSSFCRKNKLQDTTEVKLDRNKHKILFRHPAIKIGFIVDHEHDKVCTQGCVSVSKRITSYLHQDEYNLTALISSARLFLPEEYLFDGKKYNKLNVLYRFEIRDSGKSEELMDTLMNREPYERTLSLYVDYKSFVFSIQNQVDCYTTKVKTKKEIENTSCSEETIYKNFSTDEYKNVLNINFGVKSFQIKSEPFWLAESQKSINIEDQLEKVQLESLGDEFGILGDTLYSVPKWIIERFCKKNSAETEYSTETDSFRLGSQTVQRLLQAINSISYLEARETGENSIADIKNKWDIIIKCRDHFYPIQAKSSLDAAEEAMDTYEMLWENGEIPFVPVIVWISPYASAYDFCNLLPHIFDVSDAEIYSLSQSLKREVSQVLNKKVEQNSENENQTNQKTECCSKNMIIKVKNKNHRSLIKQVIDLNENEVRQVTEFIKLLKEEDNS